MTQYNVNSHLTMCVYKAKCRYARELLRVAQSACVLPATNWPEKPHMSTHYEAQHTSLTHIHLFRYGEAVMTLSNNEKPCYQSDRTKLLLNRTIFFIPFRFNFLRIQQFGNSPSSRIATTVSESHLLRSLTTCQSPACDQLR